MKKIISLAFYIFFFKISAVFAGEVYPHELMFFNCTQQVIHVTNGDKLPYKFSMDPLYTAWNGYSPSYSFDIPAQLIYRHPITVYINHWEDGGMHLFLSGAINSEILINTEDDYINVKHDPRYVTFIGYNDNWEPFWGARTIIGLGCGNVIKKDGILVHQAMGGNFKVRITP